MRTVFALVAFVAAAVTAQSTTPYYITAPIQGTAFKAGSRYVHCLSRPTFLEEIHHCDKLTRLKKYLQLYSAEIGTK